MIEKQWNVKKNYPHHCFSIEGDFEIYESAFFINLTDRWSPVTALQPLSC